MGEPHAAAAGMLALWIPHTDSLFPEELDKIEHAESAPILLGRLSLMAAMFLSEAESMIASTLKHRLQEKKRQINWILIIYSI